MKLTTALLLSLSLVGACSSHKKHEPTRAEMTQALKQQRAEIITNSMIAAMDKRDWKEFEKNFAYRSVVCFEEPLLLKPEEVSKRMSPMIEYFDSTKHTLTDFKLEERDERILGTAKVTGNYWKNKGLTSDVAEIFGKYEFEYIIEGDELKISRMRFISEKMKGERDIVKSAMTKNALDIPYKVEVLNFPSRNGKSMRGWLYTPRGSTHDVVIMNGNIGNIKEQGPHQYARHMANAGLAALVFDFVNFGESEGSVRNLEDPGQKIEDFRGAVDFVANRREFAAARISLAGLGASAGYIAEEAAKDNRVDRLVMIAPWLQSPELVQQNRPNAHEKIRDARQANHQFQQDGVLTYVPVASFSDQNAVMTSEFQSELDYYTNPDRGNIPQWQNRFAVMGWSHWLNFDSTSSASRIRVPTLIIHTEADRNLAGTEEFISKMKTKPEVHALSTSPFDFYDREETMKQTVEIVEDFLNPSQTDSEVTTL